MIFDDFLAHYKSEMTSWQRKIEMIFVLALGISKGESYKVFYHGT